MQVKIKYEERVIMEKQKRSGVITVAATYILWGVLPLFWNLLHEVDSVYILCSRVVWSLVFCTVYLAAAGRMGEIGAVFKDRMLLTKCALAGAVICINWGSYIWAVNNGHLLDSSFGYYINPMISVFIGAVFLREKLSSMTWIAVILSGAGVLYAVIQSGTVPVLALVIGGSFAVYGMIKKFVVLPSEVSLFMETMVAAPFALAYMIFMEISGKGGFTVLSGWSQLLLPMTGIITAIPLLLFAYGVRRIPLYLSGILMYLNPTIQFLMGILLYKESPSRGELVSFVCIWAAIGIMLAETWLRGHKSREKKEMLKKV